MDDRYEDVSVDGVVLKIPAASSWGNILASEVFLGERVALIGEGMPTTGLASFVAARPREFALALYKFTRSWIPMVLFRVSEGFRRVQLEQTFCTGCQAKWHIANPAYASLYYAKTGFGERPALSEYAKRHPCCLPE
jgi:hypothetical protein